MATTRPLDPGARPWLAFGAALLALTAGASAHADRDVGVCSVDADCGDGFDCDLGPTATRDCPPGDQACNATPPEPPVGRCEPSAMKCERDADCVTGLACEHHDDGDCTTSAAPAAADAGTAPTDSATCAPAEPSAGECVYRFVSCTKNSDCDGGFVCTALGSTGECSSADPAACTPGQACPAPQESQCTETTLSYCFPARVDCSTDDDCKQGTRCVPLPADAQENPPPSWKGATALCVPEAIALVLEGRVEASGVASSSSDSTALDSGSEQGSRTPTDSKITGAAGAAPQSDKPDTLDSDGCAVSAPGARGAGQAFCLLLGAIALVFLRRRTAAQR